MKDDSSHNSRDIWPLYGAAFGMATSLSVLWTAMPFIVRDIGGSEEHVGLVWAVNMLGYLLCLLYNATKLGHLNPRHTTRAAAAVMFFANMVMAVVVFYAISQNQYGRLILIWTVIGAGILAGGAMSLYWPYLMTWVSADYEGPSLNRRLGAYNGTWSGAAIIGPLIGGVLVDISTVAPIILSMVCLLICFILLCLAHDGSAGTAAKAKQDIVPVAVDIVVLRRFKWMARISLFCSWFYLGISRSQFALLFTDLGFTETQYGAIIMVFGICNFLIMTGAGRCGFWHFKTGFLLCGQLFLVLSLFLIIFGHNLWAFVPAFVVMGTAFGFAYSSHLYYGACGSKKRSTQMAIHEATLSLGIIIGAGTGGYLAENLGVYWPYWFGVIVLFIGLLAQAVILTVLRPGQVKNVV